MAQLQNPSSGGKAVEITADTPAPTETAHARRLPNLWRNRDFLLLWSGQLVSTIGSQVSLLAFPLLVLAITHPPAQAGLVGAVRGLFFAILCLPAGALVDRCDRKRVMLLCDGGRALTLSSIPLALWFGRMSFLQLCLVALIVGTLFTFFSLAEAACPTRVVPKEHLPAATPQNQTIDSTAWLFGPLLGGLLYGLGSTVPFLMDAVTYLCSVLSLCFMRAKFQGEHPEAPRSIWKEIGEGLLWLWRDSLLRFLALLSWGLGTLAYGYALILITLAQRLHASPFVIGVLFAGSGVGSIVGSFLAAPLQKRVVFGWLSIWSAWVCAVSWLAFALTPNSLIRGAQSL